MSNARPELPVGMGTCKSTTDYGRVIDPHMHWYPQAFVDLMIKKGPAYGAVIGEDKDGPVVVSVPGGTQKSSMRRTMTNVDSIIAAMDLRRVNANVLSMTNPLVYWAPPGFGLELSAVTNDACIEIHNKYPDRFYGVITLPFQDVKLSLEELDRMANQPAMRAVWMAEHINGKNPHEKEFWPIYERCQELNLPLFFTNLYPTDPERMKDFFMINTVGNPEEAGYAAVSMMCGGVLDAFPKLDVFMPHAGGLFPWIIGRLAKAMEFNRELKHLKQPAHHYLRRFHYDLITHEPQIMRWLIDLVGVDRICIGTDFPQAMAVMQPLDFVESIPNLTFEERRMILSETPKRLLRL